MKDESLNNKYLFNNWDPLTADKRIEEIVASIGAGYSLIEEDGIITAPLRHFELFNEYSDVQFLKVFKAPGMAHYLLFALLRNIYPEQHIIYPDAVIERNGPMQHQIFYSLDDVDIFGMVTLQNDYGDVLICPETFGDRIHELFDHEEVRFPGHERLNKKYYVLAKDPDKLKSVISDSLIERIESLDNAYIEIHNRHFVISFKRNADEKTAGALSSFLDEEREWDCLR